jgi:hypothetical protein
MFRWHVRLVLPYGQCHEFVAVFPWHPDVEKIPQLRMRSVERQTDVMGFIGTLWRPHRV